MALKRKRKQTSRGAEIGNTNERTQMPGPSMTDLPASIFIDILLKLSTKSIVWCKCVCKTWHRLISDPQFAKLHLAQSKTCPLIRDLSIARISRALYLLEPEDGRGFELGYCWCESAESKCEGCCLNIKRTSKLKIPLRNAQVLLSHVDNGANVIFSTEASTRKNVVELKSNWDHRCSHVSSCNGLLCLNEGSGRDRVVVCNPITGEFIYLPKSCNDKDNDNLCFFTVGFGFSPKNNQYKVMRTFHELTKNHPLGIGTVGERMAEIHMLGTDTWRNVDASAFKQHFSASPTYLNGALHWFCRENEQWNSVVSFDLDEERFHFHSIPSPPCRQYPLALGVLGVCLCLWDDHYSTVEDDRHIDIWVMKEYGVYKSWTKSFSFDIYEHQKWHPHHCHQPISYLNNGALLMFHRVQNELIYYDKLGGLRYKHLMLRGANCLFFCLNF